MSNPPNKISQARAERVARIYHRNTDAAQALGITRCAFGKVCRRYGIESPYVRKRRQQAERRTA